MSEHPVSTPSSELPEPLPTAPGWEHLFTLSPHDFLLESYRTLLRRDIDASGYSTYSRMLVEGWSYSAVVASLCDSDEFRAIGGADDRLTAFVDRYRAAQSGTPPEHPCAAERDHPTDRQARAELRGMRSETPSAAGRGETADAESPLWQGLFDHIHGRSHLLYWRTIGELVRQRGQDDILRSSRPAPERPMTIMQFWDTAEPPADVVVFMDKWSALYPGRYHRFCAASAGEFIEAHFDEDVAAAFGKCWHPAMQADFFRLCYLYRNGGAYIDADEEPRGLLPEFDLAGSPFLALRPFIHVIENGEKTGLTPAAYRESQAIHPNAEVYFNNAPILCSPRNPIVYLALVRATSLLLSGRAQTLSIHDSTGPTTLSLAVVIHFLICGASGRKPVDVMSIDWDLYARVGTQDELAYKRDGRDWRKAVNGAAS